MCEIIRNWLNRIFRNSINDNTFNIENTTNSALKDPMELIKMAQEYYSKGSYRDAIKCYENAIEIDPENHRILTLRAMAKSRIRDFKGSINDLKTVVSIDPGDGLAWHGLAENFFETNELTLAKEAYDKAIECGVTSHNVYFMRGKINYTLKKYKEAYEDLTASIQKEGRLIESYVYLGLVCNKLGIPDEELQNYDQAIRLGCKDPSVYFNRGMVNLEKKEINKAREDFMKASRMGFEDADKVLNQWYKYTT